MKKRASPAHLPDESCIQLPSAESGQKPFLLGFLERLPSSAELGLSGSQGGTTFVTTATNDKLDED